MLGRHLRRSAEAVPADFTDRMLRQIRESQERRILARVVLQERLALAGCIVLVAATVLAPMFLSDSVAGAFQGKAAGFTDQWRAFLDKIPSALSTVLGQWQLYVVLAGVFGFAAYSFTELFNEKSGITVQN
jgi:hypothetical protein